MKNKRQIIVNGNQAVAHIAYKANDVCAIYPITPSSEMSELVEEWNAEDKQNIFGDVPSIFEMQSEAGVAGALHGALQTGSLATTFTASQGLLLLMPNMYKIAGQLTPNVIHVATRSIATHALSVFSDHSDIMAVRNTGYAFLGASSVQEAMDFALIAQSASLRSRIPFVHFFDGFRTSHETSKISLVDDEVIRTMLPNELVQTHRERALNPNCPVIRGTSQGSDTFFQSREAINSFYDACPNLVQEEMNKFSELTGRTYKLFDYKGHKEAEYVIIAMASATETIERTIDHLNSNGAKIGLIKVRLFRPFSTEYLLQALPESCKGIAVLDRTKEPGASGEPLYLDIVQSLNQANAIEKFQQLPTIVGGRYGLSSKEFTPAMVKGIVDNLMQTRPKNNFTVGITDDITHLSITYPDTLSIKESLEVLFYETKSNDTTKGVTNLMQLLGNEHFEYIQQYTECDYRKSKSKTIGNLRLGWQPIKAPYLIGKADFIGCDSIVYIKEALGRINEGGILLVDSNASTNDFLKLLSIETKALLSQKKVSLFTVNTQTMATNYAISEYAISAIHTCLLALSKEITVIENMDEILAHITPINILNPSATKPLEAIVDEMTNYSFLDNLINGKGNELSVGQFPVDGTYGTNTSKYNKGKAGEALPVWIPDLCIQCGACSMACPQGSIRAKAYDDTFLTDAPESFKAARSMETEWIGDLVNFTIQVNPEQCTDCNNCVDACPAKALVMTSSPKEKGQEQENWNHFNKIPELERTKLNTTKVSQQQFQEPLFKYGEGVDGCGEAPYLKLISQLFGDRMLVANATGSSSIFGGALPTTPWSTNNEGSGPAWSNSLFEDTAEFGLGYRLSIDHQERMAKTLLKGLGTQLAPELVQEITSADQTTELGISQQRIRIESLKKELIMIDSLKAKQLLDVADYLVKKSVWIVGGDGWAYDIGYGGLDHAIASGKNINILVLDNEVYSNTGGQMSKATPFGATAKFAANGKIKQKKDLGQLAMTYDDVYVGSVAIGADQQQTLRTFVEAERFDGPSVIIAYCHSPTHGIDMRHPSQYHKAAVASGQWLLYRHDPEKPTSHTSALQLDSKAPSIPIGNYLRMEKRFAKLIDNHRIDADQLTQEIQQKVDKRYSKYLQLSSITQVETGIEMTMEHQ